MTQKEYISLLKNPENVNIFHVQDLRSMSEIFPYLVSARVLLSKALKLSDSLHFSYISKQTSLYVFDRRWFYFFLYPEKKQVCLSENAQKTDDNISGNYFEMIDTIERQGSSTKSNLREMAEKLKMAHSEFNPPQKPKNVEIQINKTEIDWETKEKAAKKLLKEKQFTAALSILEEINLNNPKKSIYFADQIRFLKLIVENSKK
jgi:hypothetical protein